MRKCASCSFHIPDQEVAYHSGLFGASDNILLCELCSKEEDESIDIHGTNDIPGLLSLYSGQ